MGRWKFKPTACRQPAGSRNMPKCHVVCRASWHPCATVVVEVLCSYRVLHAFVYQQVSYPWQYECRATMSLNDECICKNERDLTHQWPPAVAASPRETTHVEYYLKPLVRGLYMSKRCGGLSGCLSQSRSVRN